MPTASAKIAASSRLLVVDLDAVLLPDVAEDAGSPLSRRPRPQALDALANLHQAGVRLFLLVLPPITDGDGPALDRQLTYCDRVQQMLQEAGARLEGAAVARPGQGGVAEALAELARRAQVRLSDLPLATVHPVSVPEVRIWPVAADADFPSAEVWLDARLAAP